MRKIQFILHLRHTGFTGCFIADVLELRRREGKKGIRRPYREYMPGYDTDKNQRK